MKNLTPSQDNLKAEDSKRPESGVLLVNLGSPRSTAVADVRRYLREFLMDERVMDLPLWKRWLVVNAFILPFRPRKTADAYRSVWTSAGSPLIVTSEKVRAALEQRLGLPVGLAMRYQEPTAIEALQALRQKGVRRLLLVPMYPHYAMSSYETAVEDVKAAVQRIAPDLALTVFLPFYDHPAYIRALTGNAQSALGKPYDHLLFSFHGLPQRHLRKADPTGRHCLQSPDCCEQPGPALKTCYRAQALKTVHAFVQAAGVPEGRFSVSFQSRLGRDPWLEPYTDFVLPKLAASGIKRLVVICPAFVTDCLETLEEMGLRGRETFLQAGGREFDLIPCLNEHPLWIEALEQFVRESLFVPETK